MRSTTRSGNFFLCLLFNLLLNYEGIIPAAILTGMHFWADWPLWWAAAAFAAWVLWLIVWMYFIGWATRCGNAPDAPRENKNPYSAGQKRQ